NPGDQRRLADIRVAHQPRIGQQLQFQPKGLFFAGTPGLVFFGSLMGGSCKTRIAAATPATVCDYQALIGTREVVDLLSCLLVVDDCSHGNLEQDVCAFPASLVGAFAVTSALGFVFRIEAEVNQSVVALAGFHDDVAALAAIAARRPAARNKLLATKRKTTVAAIAGLHTNFGFINKHDSRSRAALSRPAEDDCANGTKSKHKKASTRTRGGDQLLRFLTRPFR